MRRMIHLGAAGIAALAAGCTTGSLGYPSATDRDALLLTVGQPYADIAAQTEPGRASIYGTDKLYGELYEAAPLPGGETLYRHIQRTRTTHEPISNSAVYVSEQSRFGYRLYYFRVGADGLIEDIANGVAYSEGLRCVSDDKGAIGQCDDAARAAQDIATMDAVVTTSEGLPLSGWR